jgi:GTP cyclohydrolase II
LNSNSPSFDQPDARRTARAIDALRRGWAIKITGTNSSMIVSAIESATADLLFSSQSLLLSSSRAATLKLTNQYAAANIDLPVVIARPNDLDEAQLIAIADPTLDLRYPMKGPFATLPLPDAEAGVAAMELARLAGILPAFLIQDAMQDDDIVTVSLSDVQSFNEPTKLRIAARAHLPVAANANAEIVAFRTLADASDHIALVVGNRDSSPPVVRLHSECLTGDILGSLKCDCGPQLHEALAQISEANWGVLLYLRQEGRGIGLINKLRAYALQDQGFDTVDANIRLGFAIDARDFSVAAQMLKLLNVESIRLLTNNPLKVAGLEKLGINISERLPLQIIANTHNADYLATKRDRTGHKL